LKLIFVNGQDAGHRFHFDHDHVLDDQIDSIAGFHRYSLVDDRNRPLCDEAQIPGGELEVQTRRVDGLEESRSERPVNFDGAGQYLASDVVVFLRVDPHPSWRQQDESRTNSSRNRGISSPLVAVSAMAERFEIAAITERSGLVGTPLEVAVESLIRGAASAPAGAAQLTLFRTPRNPILRSSSCLRVSV